MMTDARPMAMTLLRGADVYVPEPFGTRDVLVVGERVARVAADLGAFAGLEGVEVRDVRGLSMVPGFIDQHVHVTGGGGGFVTRGPEATSRAAAGPARASSFARSNVMPRRRDVDRSRHRSTLV